MLRSVESTAGWPDQFRVSVLGISICTMPRSAFYSEHLAKIPLMRSTVLGSSCLAMIAVNVSALQQELAEMLRPIPQSGLDVSWLKTVWPALPGV